MKEINLIDIIRDLLKNRTPRIIDNTESRYIPSSVLIPIFRENEQYRVLFTRRTNRVEHHKGQISFPGGAVDKEDATLEETALREADEEIGLIKGDVEILGRLDDTLTMISDYIIHPFVGMIPFPYDFNVNLNEVDSLIFIPLKVFADNSSGHKKDLTEVAGFPYHGTAYEYQGNVIWGATARIMENLMEIIGEKIILA